MTYSEAKDKFGQILNLLRQNDQLPASYDTILRAMASKLDTLAKLEQTMKGGK